MPSKTTKPKQKIADVAEPKKASAASASPQLVIPHRDIITHGDNADIDDGDSVEAASDSHGPQASDTPAPQAPLQSASASATSTTSSGGAAIDVVSTTKKHTKSALRPSAAATASASSQNGTDDLDSLSANDDVITGETTPTPSQNPKAKKAADDAKNDNHNQELQSYIDNREYNVPINAVASKRSIKVSIVLTFLVLLLSIALIDLMLDSGLIELIQKIPHTHYFNVGNN